MPRVIAFESAEHCSLEDCVEALADQGFDPDCEDSLQNSAAWLRKLGNNRTFLGDMLIDYLKPTHRSSMIESGFSPQAIVLSPMVGGTFLRANIWPSERDHCFQSSGAQSFVYGVPHDHNFSFLTSGYFGPGYRSDYYEYDYKAVAGYDGEEVPLHFVERATLSPGKLMLYRAHRDVHSQIPPESLSVSLNVMHIGLAQAWFDQYGFDLDRGEIARVLSPNSTEVFLRIAVGAGHADAIDLAAEFGKIHPSDRIRLASYEARTLIAGDASSRDALWREAEISGCRMFAETARRKRCELEAV